MFFLLCNKLDVFVYVMSVVEMSVDVMFNIFWLVCVEMNVCGFRIVVFKVDEEVCVLVVLFCVLLLFVCDCVIKGLCLVMFIVCRILSEVVSVVGGDVEGDVR